MKSLPERSALSPIETNDEKPRPRAAASSIAAIPNPPLCDAKPSRPGGGATGAAAASNPSRGSRRRGSRGRPVACPRSGRRRAARRRPSTPASQHDERAHTLGGAPARGVETASGATAITASSTSPSTTASAAASSTRCTAPAKLTSASPITATEDGRRTWATAATSAVRWRSSKRCRAAGDSEVGNSISISPSARRRRRGSRSRGTRRHPAVLRQDGRGERLDPLLARRRRRWASSTVAMPWPSSIGHREATPARPEPRADVGHRGRPPCPRPRAARAGSARRRVRGAARGLVEVHPGAEEAEPARRIRQ